MTNFDFHRLLSPSEFENFCRDLLEIRETDIKFTTYRRGRDGGIDIRGTNTEEKIIGQCKLYDPTNYSGLLRNLKKEAAKCKRQAPDRYILCINIELTPTRASEIKQIFKGYIQNEEDIIDGIKLNKHLSQELYQNLFKSYSKLLVPNLQSVELALDKVVYRKYYQKTNSFLQEIEAKHLLFHHTLQIPFLIEQLEENKIIILTGNPGVGKTTTAMIIANYFLSKKVKDLIFLEERDYIDVLSVVEEDRLIVIDDFWGQKFSPDVKNHSTFQREFQTIIRHFANSNNCYLILTSRDYVLKDVLKGAELETQNLLDTNKHIIKIEDYSNEDKVKILLNHLLFYDFDLSYFQTAQYEDSFKHIIDHKNYSPRHLDFFIKSYLKEGYQSSYAFYKSLYKYLDNPKAFWNQAFQKLNPTAKTILIILLASGAPLDIRDLKVSFDNIQMKAREVLNEGIIPTDFNQELIKLNKFYIAINQDSYYYDISVEFQSPGIKDYLLEFLRNEGYIWIYPIISNAKFFNQLTLIFSTKKEKISDYDSDIPLYGQKILLNQDLKSILKQKLLGEFESLNFCNYEGKELTDELTKYNSQDETKYFKIIELNRLFPIELEENKDIRNFIVENVLADVESFDSSNKVVAHRSMIYFPGVVQSLLPYTEINPDNIIWIYFNSITFASEYRHLYDFKEIFASEFQKFYSLNIQKIRKHIKELIFDDIDYYLDQDEGEVGVDLDSLLNWEIKELRKQYNFRLTEKYIKELETTFDINLSSLRKEKKPRKKTKHSDSASKQKEKEYESEPYNAIIEEYLPDYEEYYEPVRFLKTQGYSELLQNLKKGNSALTSLKDGKEVFESICHFIVENEVAISSLCTYQLIDEFFNYHCLQIRVEPRTFIKVVYRIINELEQLDGYSITKSRVTQILKETELQNVRIEDIRPILIPYKNWYQFSHSDIKTYIVSKHINSAEIDQFSELVTESLWEPDDFRILSFLQSANRDKTWMFYIIPELERLLDSINFANEQTVLHSFIDFFSVEFDLAWEKKEKRFDSFSSSNSESHYENLLHFCGIEFYVSDFETYFEDDYQHGDTITKLNINTKILRKLYKRIIETVPKKTSRYLLREDPITVFEIKLSDFLKSEENYSLARDIGMESYINDVIRGIKGIVKNKKAQTANKELW